MSQEPEVNEEVVDELLSLPNREQQANFLHEAGLLNADGFDKLLDEADRLLGSDPGKTQQLAEICTDLAGIVEGPAIVARASYIRAGVHNANGEFEEDLRLTQEAYKRYIALGMNLEALRTNVGKMAALLEQGYYYEALHTGQILLNTLDGRGPLKVTPTQQQSNFLVALVQQNRGRCLEYMGRYDEALEAYAVAEKHYQDLGTVERLSEIAGNRGAVLLQLGRGNEALAAYKSVADVSSEAGLSLSLSKALVNIGEAHLHLGNYGSSLEAFEQARPLLDDIEGLADKNLFLRHTADAYLALNLYSEALAAYREAEPRLRSAGMVHDLAHALWGTGSVLSSLSRFEEAEEALAEAATLFESTGNLPLLSSVMLEQASLLEVVGKPAAALDTATRALETISGDLFPVQLVYAHLRLADLLLPNTIEAGPHLLQAQRLAGSLALPQLRYRLKERLGRVRRLEGRPEEARRMFEAAIEEVEQLRGSVSQDALRASFLQDKVAVYEELLKLYLDSGNIEDIRRAFTVAERSKSRALVDLLIGVTEREAATAKPELEERLQSLQADLNAVYSQLLVPEKGTRGATLTPLSNRAAELEQEISRLRLQVTVTENNSFAAASLFEDLFVTDALKVTLIAYHAIEEEILAFVVSKDRIRVVRSVSTVPRVQQLLQQLTVQWERVQAGGKFTDRKTELLEKSARRVLGALHDQLVAPLGELADESEGSGELESPDKLVVVPHGILHQVPFQALFDSQQYLLEKFEISYAPSATVYGVCQERKPSDSGKALVMGVEDPTIPNAVDEACTVAEHLSGAEVRVGEGATIAALRREASGCDVLHLACHGLFRDDNPMFSSLKLDDGWLMAADAMRLDLEGALVALSACESGRSEVIGGDEVLGLTRAFLGTGATTLVVSLWLVQDEATAELMNAWYRRLRDGMGRASALRAAQLEVKDRYPHPFYWAPFVLIGKR